MLVIAKVVLCLCPTSGLPRFGRGCVHDLCQTRAIPLHLARIVAIGFTPAQNGDPKTLLRWQAL
jgi:hypothetical protein